MQQMIPSRVLLVLLLVLLGFPASPGTLLALSDSEIESALYVVKNREAALDHRKTALDKLLSVRSEDLHETYINLLGEEAKSPEEKKFHLYLLEKIESNTNSDLRELIERMSLDSRGDKRTREILFAILWKANDESAVPLFLKILNNHREDEKVRANVMAYLMKIQPDEKLLEAARKIFLDGNLKAQFRVLAVGILKNNEDTNAFKELFLKVMQDTSEDLALRRMLITNSVFLDFPEVEDLLLGIIRNQRNSPVLKKAAITALSAKEELASKTLSEIKLLYAAERDIFAQEELRTLLESKGLLDR